MVPEKQLAGTTSLAVGDTILVKYGCKKYPAVIKDVGKLHVTDDDENLELVFVIGTREEMLKLEELATATGKLYMCNCMPAPPLIGPTIRVPLYNYV